MSEVATPPDEDLPPDEERCAHVDTRGQRCRNRVDDCPGEAGSGNHRYARPGHEKARRNRIGETPAARKQWRRLIDAPDGLERQPVDQVRWVDHHELQANDYNPNHVAPPEMRGLKISLLSDGWTQPIVARADGEIVDGYHRWLVSFDDEVEPMTGGMVPVVYLPSDTSEEHQRMSTIRHNRARGTHHVVRMAEIVAGLADSGVEASRIAELMQMDHEEVDRLLDRGSMTARHGDAGSFSSAWTVAPNKDAPEEEIARRDDDDGEHGTRL